MLSFSFISIFISDTDSGSESESSSSSCSYSPVVPGKAQTRYLCNNVLSQSLFLIGITSPTNFIYWVVLSYSWLFERGCSTAKKPSISYLFLIVLYIVCFCGNITISLCFYLCIMHKTFNTLTWGYTTDGVPPRQRVNACANFTFWIQLKI